MRLTDIAVSQLKEAVCSCNLVSGYTHEFYKYPARFSPEFARCVIKTFTERGDLVLDPFMGGGTTLVEARLSGRLCIGSDINELSIFLGKIKTRVFLKKDLNGIYEWATSLRKKLNLHNPPIRATKWIEEGYQHNINSRKTWPIRKLIEFFLAHLNDLPKKPQKMFVRCALMKTAQWALDCNSNIPSAKDFRERLIDNITEMRRGALEFSRAVRQTDNLVESNRKWRTVCLNQSAIGLESAPIIRKKPAPNLILTSPPYPGVHVLYHRWQINGRKETPAPFWIANAQDGHGSSFYTFGGRKKSNVRYFDVLSEAYRSLAKISDERTVIVQMVGFSKPTLQLPKYLKIMEEAGFEEHNPCSIAGTSDGRLWRFVPNRKWYAIKKGSIGSSKEVVLFHRLRS